MGPAQARLSRPSGRRRYTAKSRRPAMAVARVGATDPAASGEPRLASTEGRNRCCSRPLTPLTFSIGGWREPQGDGQMRVVSAILATAAVLAAGSARAADFIVNLTTTPMVSTLNNQPDYFGTIVFPDVLLGAGDTLTANVTFTSPLAFARPIGPDSFAVFNVRYGTLATGDLMFVTPFGYQGNASGFTLHASAVPQNPTIPNPTGRFDLNSITFRVAAIPEPGTWAMLLLGLGATGALLRRRRGEGRAALTNPDLRFS